MSGARPVLRRGKIMNIRKWITAFFIAAALALSVPALIPAHGTAEAAADTSENGWHTDANGTYYLKNGKRVRGWKTIGGKRYYFKKKNGCRAVGTFKIDGKCYLFRPEGAKNSGALCRGVSGLVHFSCDPDTFYYLNAGKNGTVATGRWLTVRGGKYYANSKGQIRLGTIRLNGRLYHITSKGRMISYGRSSYDGHYYYAGTDGVLKAGRQKISGRLYYFNTKTGIRAEGLTLKLGKYHVYFKKKDGAAKAGWLKLSDDRVYYFTKYFHRVSGWYTVNGKKYYFDPANDDIRVQGCWKKIGGKNYYFGTDDAAIVCSRGADYILVVMAHTPGSGWWNASRITSLSRIVYNYFN